MPSITFSSAELEQLTRAVQLLVSPLDHATVDDWRRSVNRHLRDLLYADSAGFLLPVAHGLMMYSEEHDPAELAAYPDLTPPDAADGTPVWEKMLRVGVGTLADIYDGDVDRYLRSEYYNEYAGANGAHDTLGLTVPLGGADVRSMAGLQFWHERPDGRRFGERELTILRLLLPAFRAGVETRARWEGLGTDLLGTLDALGQAVMVCSVGGALLHETPALQTLLRGERGAAMLRAEMFHMVESLRALAGPRKQREPEAPAPIREVRTAAAEYVVRGSIHRPPTAGSGAMAMVALERVTPRVRPAAELREAFSLTQAELRVAALLARGRSNRQIAEELCISPHTSRRHTERILRKLDVNSRAQVAPRLLY